MLNIKIVSRSLGIFTAISFVLCLIYRLIESLLYGAHVGLVFVPIHNFLARRWGGPGMRA